MSESTEKMVRAIADESPTEFEASFNSAIAGKISAALTQKKEEIAAVILEKDEEEGDADDDGDSIGEANKANKTARKAFDQSQGGRAGGGTPDPKKAPHGTRSPTGERTAKKGNEAIPAFSSKRHDIARKVKTRGLPGSARY